MIRASGICPKGPGFNPDELVDGLVLDSKAEPDPICEPCLVGKMHANPFPSSEHCAICVNIDSPGVHQID